MVLDGTQFRPIQEFTLLTIKIRTILMTDTENWNLKIKPSEIFYLPRYSFYSTV